MFVLSYVNPGLNKILDEYNNGITNYLKESVSEKFKKDEHILFFSQRPFNLDWIYYSALDVVFLQKALESMQDDIKLTISNEIKYNLNAEDIRLLSIILSNDHVKSNCCITE